MRITYGLIDEEVVRPLLAGRRQCGWHLRETDDIDELNVIRSSGIINVVSYQISPRPLSQVILVSGEVAINPLSKVSTV